MVEAQTVVSLSIVVLSSLLIIYYIFVKSKIKSKPAHELISFYLIAFLISNLISYCGALILKETYLKDQLKSMVFLISLMLSPAFITYFYEPFSNVGAKKLFGIFTKKSLYYGISIIVVICIINPILSSIIWHDVKFSISADTVLNNLKHLELKDSDIQKIKEQLSLNPILLILILVIQAVFAGSTINAVFAYGEERAWRYFALKRFFQLGFGFWQTSFITGFLWGLWHYPVIVFGYNFPNHPYIGVLFMSVSCALMTPLFVIMTSLVPHVLTAAILHGVFNATGNFSALMISGGNDLQTGAMASTCWVIFGIVNIAIIAFDSSNPKKRVNPNELSVMDKK